MMDSSITTVLISGSVSLITTIGTIYASARSARRLESLTKEHEQTRVRLEQQKVIKKFSEPLARAAYDLQSRLFNILQLDFIQVFLVNGDDRERLYAVNNTLFLIAQYACWTELIRREIRFIDLDSDERTRTIQHLQDEIFHIWGSDAMASKPRIFAGELRAIGESLIQEQGSEIVCTGYGQFLEKLGPGINVLIDAVRQDIETLGHPLPRDLTRLQKVQHVLIDLLALLDPDYVRFPLRSRSKS